MARQVHTVVDVVGPYPLGSVGANTADISFVAADTSNLEQAALDYPIILLVYNSDGANPYTVTVDVVSGTAITGYTLQAGEVAGFEFRPSGWKQPDGTLHFQANNAAIKFAVLKKG